MAEVADFETKFCQECGTSINRKAVICPNCGVKQPGVSTNSKNKVVAGLFALFLGGIGIHKFYLGRIGMGIIYLLFSWTLIPLIIAFFEGIILIAMSDDRFEAKYG